MAAANRTSPVEAFRAQILLEECLKKLSFLSSISADTGNELTEFMGDEISRIIQEQRDLEKKYEELILLRGNLVGLTNKSQRLQVQGAIQDVAHKLRESNKSLCRNLKENPNVQGNLAKMQAERARVTEWLEDLRGELDDFSFQNLVQKVEEERRSQEMLNEMKKKEREASQTVKTLDAELHREHQEHERETKAANQEIKELKEDLQKNKTISTIELSFEEKKLRAQENALLRVFAQKEKALHEEELALREAIRLEGSVHDKARAFLQTKCDSLQEQRTTWQEKSDKEIAQMTTDLEKLKGERGFGVEELRRFQDRMAQEVAEQKAKEDEQRNAVIMEQQRKEQEDRMVEAIETLQAEGRKYIVRIQERAALKKGKKGKKGKKK